MFPLAPGALRILHLSDTHLTGDGALHQGSVDTTAALDAVLAGVDALEGVGAVVVSGDCSEDGSPASYAHLRDRVGDWALMHGAAFVSVPGNHDLREGFRQVLSNGHVLGPGGSPLAHTMEYTPPEIPVTGVSTVDGWRIVTLDTSVPGAGYGELADTTIERLRAFLSEPSEHGTVVVLHHPPLPAPTLLHDALKLRNPEALSDAIAGSDVRVVLAGHYHHHVASSIRSATEPERAPVPVLVAPGVANDTVVCGSYDQESATAAHGALIVDVAPDGTVISTPVRIPVPGDDRQAFHHDAATVALIAAEAGPTAPETD